MRDRTLADLKAMQALPLTAKVEATTARAYDWIDKYGTDGVYWGFSGGQQILCDYLVNVALREIMGRNVPLWIDEICRVTNDTEKIKQIFVEHPTDAQRICLVTTDGVTLPVTSVKDVYAR